MARLRVLRDQCRWLPPPASPCFPSMTLPSQYQQLPPNPRLQNRRKGQDSMYRSK